MKPDISEGSILRDLEIDDVELLELFADAPYGAYAVDMNQRIVFWNRTAEKILGYAAEEVLGERCYRVMGGALESDTPNCAPRCAAVLWAREGSVAPSYTTRVRTKGGEEKWLTITHVLLPAEARQNSAVVHILYDITDQIEGKLLLENFGKYLARAAPVPAPVGPPPPEPDPDDDEDKDKDKEHDLTPRELEVLRLLGRGKGTKAIAEDLVVSEATVRTHIQRLLNKLGANNRLEAVTAAARRGII